MDIARKIGRVLEAGGIVGTLVVSICDFSKNKDRVEEILNLVEEKLIKKG